MMPVVSVIVPTYRRTKPLKDALFSLCNQDYPAIEIVVVDDNGLAEWNSQVSQIVQEVQPSLSSKHAFKLVTNEKNMGVAKSRNIGIHASSGEFITFLDDDDAYLPAKISTQLAGMQHANADYSLMDLDLFNEKGQLVEHRTHPQLSSVSDQAELVRFHLMYHLTGTDTLMFRRDYLLQIGCFGSIDIGDEFYLMMKAIEHGGKFVYLPHSLVRASVHYDGTGLSGGPQKFEGEDQLFAFKRQYFSRLCRKDIRYIRMRHHAVLAYAHFRMNHLACFLQEALRSVLAAPLACARMLYHRKQ